MTERVHSHGALAGIELFHGGSGSSNAVSRRPLLAPSPIVGERLSYSVPKQMDADRHRAGAAPVGRRRPALARHRLRHRVRLRRARVPARRSSSLRTSTSAPTATAATSPVAPGCGWRRWNGYGLRSGADCTIAVRMTVDGRGTPGIEIDEGAGVRAARRRSRGPVGRERRLLAAGLGHRPLLPAGPRARAHGPGARGHRQADRQRGPVHRCGHDGGARTLGRHRRDRCGAARDRRPVPADEDRARAASTRSGSAPGRTCAS